MCPTSYKNLPIGMKVEIAISWSIMNDQDMIIYNYVGVQKIAVLDKFLQRRKVVAKKLNMYSFVHTKITCPLCILP